MSFASNTRSFRLRLIIQTMIVAWLLVGAFGAAAWWYARGTLERSLDDRIIVPAQRVWSRIDPHTSNEEFESIADLVFGSVPDENAAAVLLVKEHQQGRTLFSTADAPTDIDAVLHAQFPTDEEIRLTHPGALQGHPPPEGRRPPPIGEQMEFGDLLGLPPDFQRGGPPPGNQGRSLRFRPQMPLVREPQLFTASSGGTDWRFGALSSPEYTLFIGLSLDGYYAELHRMTQAFAAMAVLGLSLAGLGAWWTSKRAMRPLERVIDTARRLNASDLAQRIPLQPDDDQEFAQLIDVLNGMMQRLDDGFQQAVRFTADASHELKTPLAVMLATLDDAVRHAAPGSPEQERFQSLFEEANRLKSITQSLLLLSQADAGRLPTHPETYDLSADLPRLIEDGEILCEQAGLTLEHRIEPGLCVHADRALLRQVFQNLLSNAIKYNRPDGRVTIELASKEAQAVFTISNTGPAIPAEHRQRLFDRFFRSDAAHNRKTDGFGLGLNIATELARANAAQLGLVRSDEDGTVFEVRLKLAGAA